MSQTGLRLGDESASIDQLKTQLALCIRMLERADIIDFNGHCSIRIGEDRILINQGYCQRSQITAADIVTIDMDGRLIEGVANPPLEFTSTPASTGREPM